MLYDLKEPREKLLYIVMGYIIGHISVGLAEERSLPYGNDTWLNDSVVLVKQRLVKKRLCER